MTFLITSMFVITSMLILISVIERWRDKYKTGTYALVMAVLLGQLAMNIQIRNNITELQTIVCLDHPDAEACRREE